MPFPTGEADRTLRGEYVTDTELSEAVIGKIVKSIYPDTIVYFEDGWVGVKKINRNKGGAGFSCVAYISWVVEVYENGHILVQTDVYDVTSKRGRDISHTKPLFVRGRFLIHRNGDQRIIFHPPRRYLVGATELTGDIPAGTRYRSTLGGLKLEHYAPPKTKNDDLDEPERFGPLRHLGRYRRDNDPDNIDE